MSEVNHSHVMTGMIVLGKLYSPDPDEQANTIAMTLMGKYDEELQAAFTYTHGESGEGMAEQLKEQFRRTLQKAINDEATRLEQEKQQEACEQFMGNQEPHALGTTAELAERYSVSKKQIRKMKQDGTLQEFIDEKR